MVMVLLAFGACSCGSGGGTAEEERSTPTNLEQLRAIAAVIAGSCLDTATVEDSLKLRLRVLPKEHSWVLEEAIRGGLVAGGARSGDAAYDRLVEFGILDMRIRYDGLRRDGFMGPRIVERTAFVSLHARITDSAGTRVLFTGDRSGSKRDTVLVSEISRLETPMLPFTVGVVPDEGVFDNVAEPLIVLGAIAVAMVLLFTVRS
jgi:hypothetical protein